MNGFLWFLEGETEAETGKMETKINSALGQAMNILTIVIWVLSAVVAVVFIIKAVSTALAVMKAADDPQARSEKLQGFKYLAIALGIALVVLLSAGFIMQFVVVPNTTVNSEDVQRKATTLLF